MASEESGGVVPFTVLGAAPWGGSEERDVLPLAVRPEDREEVLRSCGDLIETARAVAALPNGSLIQDADATAPINPRAFEAAIRAYRDRTPGMEQFRTEQDISRLDVITYACRVTERLLRTLDPAEPPRSPGGYYNDSQKAALRVEELAQAIRRILERNASALRDESAETASEETALVLVEAEETAGGKHDHWKDVTGSQYQYPNQYKNRIRQGLPFLYYRGVRRGDGKRGTPEYFGCGRIGQTRVDPDTAHRPKKDQHWFCDLEEYVPFSTPVAARLPDGSFLESIGHQNLWGVGVRVIPLAVYELIVAAGGVVTPQPSEVPIAPAPVLPSMDVVTPATPAERDTVLRPQAEVVQTGQAGPGASGGKGRRRSRYAKLIGDRAEEIVHRELQRDGVAKLCWRSQLGETPGWDMDYEEEGVLTAVEVKGTTADAFASFEMSAPEWTQAQALRDRYVLYLVSRCSSTEPRLAIIRDPVGAGLVATPAMWRIVAHR